MEPSQAAWRTFAMFDISFKGKGKCTNFGMGVANGCHNISASISILPNEFLFYSKKGILNECNTMAAEYLFQTDKHYDIQYDTGDKVIQCGRHNDIMKFWLMWRAKVIFF